MSHTKPSVQYLEKLRERYAQASKTERGQILDEFVATTGYHRKHAIALLRGQRRHRDSTKPIRRPRARFYTAEDQRAVLWLAQLFDQINSKRLRSALTTELGHLREQGHFRFSRQCFQHMQRISPASMDRMRRIFRMGAPPHRGGTKPGSLLKQQIPIRTFADWNDQRPGFGEIDLVQHEGGNSAGLFACSLNFTDVSTAWIGLRAVPTKAQGHVFAALKEIRTELPFPLLGLDSDNGAEFINDELVRYCVQEQLTFTRGRAGRKNDNPYVEQKNWSVVRRLVGYARYDTARQVQLLNQLYRVYTLYVNHFLPVMKLLRKERQGSRIKRIYDEPKTPYQRVLDAPTVSQIAKTKLRAQHRTLDIVHLKQQIDQYVTALKVSAGE